MTTDSSSASLVPAAPRRVAPPMHARARLFGFGSVFGKTLRDSRTAMLAIGGLLVVMVMAGGATMASSYGTPETRLELGRMSREMPPLMRGMYGNPVNVDTLGGFIAWHYGAYFALLAGLWSILALSSTLAVEARRGTLEFTVAAPITRRTIALEKVAAHLVAMIVVAAAIAVAAWLTSAVFGLLPGDEITIGAAAGFAIGLAARALVAGAVAFALAPLLGRSAAAGIAGAAMVGSYVVYSWRTAVPAFDSLAGFTPFAWAAGHIPLAGQWDWAGVAITAAVAGGLLGLGVLLFVRRDIGVVWRVPSFPVPGFVMGVRGPVSRASGEQLPAAMWWGIGLGAYGILMAGASGTYLDLLANSPTMTEVFRSLIPGMDLTTAAGFLQLAFVDLGLVLIGLAATTFVATWASDEPEGRLELPLAAPVGRRRWAISGGIAMALGLLVTVMVLAAAMAGGMAMTGNDPTTPTLGTFALLFYGAAVAGVGAAVGGVFGASRAVAAALGFTVGTFILDLFGQLLRLPDWITWLALTTHLGEPMIGRWDVAGLAACVAIAIGGVAAGAWGFAHRDIVD